MKISARNSLPGVIQKIDLGAVKSLKLKVGDRAYAVIKASSVMVGID